LTKPAFTLRCQKPPAKAGRTNLLELAEPLQQLTNQTTNFNLLRESPLAQI